jgi:uncharacterized protein YeeX (DUF496 family)
MGEAKPDANRTMSMTFLKNASLHLKRRLSVAEAEEVIRLMEFAYEDGWDDCEADAEHKKKNVIGFANE